VNFNVIATATTLKSVANLHYNPQKHNIFPENLQKPEQIGCATNSKNVKFGS
jgi:hypothetical protein